MYTGFDANNPSYIKSNTSWSHFYDNFIEWSTEIQSAAIRDLEEIGTLNEVVDAILTLDGKEERALLVRKAIDNGMKFDHENFSVYEVILDMPKAELKKALYLKAVEKGVRFTKDQMQDAKCQVQKTGDSLDVVGQTEQHLPEREKGKTIIKGILVFLGMNAMAVFSIVYVLLGCPFLWWR